MQSVGPAVRRNLGYVFILFGLIWAAVAFASGSVYVLWPALACGVGGVLLKMRPASRLTIAWAPAASLLGLVLSAYQVYSAVPLLSGEFVTIAGASVALFLVLGLGHAYLAYESHAASQVK
jgi:hypothetical protein